MIDFNKFKDIKQKYQNDFGEIDFLNLKFIDGQCIFDVFLDNLNYLRLSEEEKKYLINKLHVKNTFSKKNYPLAFFNNKEFFNSLSENYKNILTQKMVTFFLENQNIQSDIQLFFSGICIYYKNTQISNKNLNKLLNHFIDNNISKTSFSNLFFLIIDNYSSKINKNTHNKFITIVNDLILSGYYDLNISNYLFKSLNLNVDKNKLYNLFIVNDKIVNSETSISNKYPSIFFLMNNYGKTKKIFNLKEIQFFLDNAKKNVLEVLYKNSNFEYNIRQFEKDLIFEEKKEINKKITISYNKTLNNLKNKI